MSRSFFATLKGDFHRHSLPDLVSFRLWTLRYTEAWYNRVRPRSYTGGVPPMTAWTLLIARPFGVATT